MSAPGCNYVIFSWEAYADNPVSILYIWEGGLAIYGGVLGAIVGIAVYCRFRHLKLATVLDVVLLGFLIGQAMGRWGNFLQPGGLRRRHRRVVPNGPVQHQDRSLGVLPSHLLV